MPDLNTSFSSEFIKEIYDDKHTDTFGTRWGRSKMYYFDKIFKGNDPITSYIDESINSILDFGCGQSKCLENILETFPDRNFTIGRYDPNIEEYNNLPERKYDLVMANMIQILHIFKNNNEEGLELISHLHNFSNEKVFLKWMTPNPSQVSDEAIKLFQKAMSAIQDKFIIERQDVNMVGDKPEHLRGRYITAMWLTKK